MKKILLFLFNITWYEIETFNGIYCRTYKIQKEYPFSVFLQDEEKLLSFRRNFLW